jgi:hypothetical protein
VRIPADAFLEFRVGENLVKLEGKGRLLLALSRKWFGPLLTIADRLVCRRIHTNCDGSRWNGGSGSHTALRGKTEGVAARECGQLRRVRQAEAHHALTTTKGELRRKSSRHELLRELKLLQLLDIKANIPPEQGILRHHPSKRSGILLIHLALMRLLLLMRMLLGHTLVLSLHGVALRLRKESLLESLGRSLLASSAVVSLRSGLSSAGQSLESRKLLLQGRRADEERGVSSPTLRGSSCGRSPSHLLLELREGGVHKVRVRLAASLLLLRLLETGHLSAIGLRQSSHVSRIHAG